MLPESANRNGIMSDNPMKIKLMQEMTFEFPGNGPMLAKKEGDYNLSHYGMSNLKFKQVRGIMYMLKFGNFDVYIGLKRVAQHGSKLILHHYEMSVIKWQKREAHSCEVLNGKLVGNYTINEKVVRTFIAPQVNTSNPKPSKKDTKVVPISR